MKRSGASKRGGGGVHRAAPPWTAALAFSGFVEVGSPARADGGGAELDQTGATRTGCLPGDTPRFPVALRASGRARPTSRLVGPDGKRHGLSVTVDDASIGLDRFAIRGPVVCNGTPPFSTTSTGSGTGITARIAGIAVRDGGTVSSGTHLGGSLCHASTPCP